MNELECGGNSGGFYANGVKGKAILPLNRTHANFPQQSPFWKENISSNFLKTLKTKDIYLTCMEIAVFSYSSLTERLPFPILFGRKAIQNYFCLC